MVKGTANTSGVNIRKTAHYPNGTVIAYMPKGSTFEGELVTGLDGKQWIELSKMNGNLQVGYIASWVVSYQEVTEPDPSPEPSYPQTFILTDPATGVRTEYVFVRVIE
jgi:hypothetical protein